MKTSYLCPLLFLLAFVLAPFANIKSSNTPTKPEPLVLVPGIAISYSLREATGWFSSDVSRRPLDLLYAMPSNTDIGHIIKFCRDHRERTTVISEAWDCDDFAREFAYLARVWSVREFPDAPFSISVGIAFLKMDGDVSDIFPRRHDWVTGYHATNIILRDDGQWFFYEPQSGALCPIESMLLEGSVTILRIEI